MANKSLSIILDDGSIDNVELVTYLICIFLSTQGSNGRIISSTLNDFVYIY